MVKAGYWDASALLDELAVAALLTLPPPQDRTLYLIGDKTTKEKTGKKMPLAHKTPMNEFAPYVCGLDLVLLIAHWGRFRISIACELVDPDIKGHQNLLFRQMLCRFQAPAWCRQIVVIADAGFASKENLRLVQELAWHYVFALPRTRKLEDGTHLKDKDQTDGDQSRQSKRAPDAGNLLPKVGGRINFQITEIRLASRADASEQRKGASRASPALASHGLSVVTALVRQRA